MISVGLKNLIVSLRRLVLITVICLVAMMKMEFLHWFVQDMGYQDECTTFIRVKGNIYIKEFKERKLSKECFVYLVVNTH